LVQIDVPGKPRRSRGVPGSIFGLNPGKPARKFLARLPSGTQPLRQRFAASGRWCLGSRSLCPRSWDGCGIPTVSLVSQWGRLGPGCVGPLGAAWVPERLIIFRDGFGEAFGRIQTPGPSFSSSQPPEAHRGRGQHFHDPRRCPGHSSWVIRPHPPRRGRFGQHFESWKCCPRPRWASEGCEREQKGRDADSSGGPAQMLEVRADLSSWAVWAAF